VDSLVPVAIWSAFVVWLALACVSDARERRIPNSLVLIGMAAGLAFQAGLPRGAGLFAAVGVGSVGLANACTAVALAALAGALLWRLRLFGGGDAKLLAAVGSFSGIAGVLPVLLLTLMAGGVLALGTAMLLRTRLGSVQEHGTAHDERRARIPYSWAIAAGSLGYAAMSRTGMVSG
jgi:prepilin peptidase CpaA